MSEHTPGPWTWHEYMESLVLKAGDATILDGWDEAGCEISPANARLIAAAPDMLAELKHIDAHGYVTFADVARVRDLIAKTEGVTERQQS